MSRPLKPLRAALYARVSTDHQTTTNQLRELQMVAERHGWEIVGEYVDRGQSGAKAPTARPRLAELMLAGQRHVDLVAAWSVDRLGRSLQDLLAVLAELHAKGVDLYLHRQGVDTTMPAGRALFQMLGVFAEFERAMIVERVNAGLKRARAQGKTLGRPRIDQGTENAIRHELAKGTGIRAVARKIGVGVGTVQRVKAENAA